MKIASLIVVLVCKLGPFPYGRVNDLEYYRNGGMLEPWLKWSQISAARSGGLFIFVLEGTLVFVF